jgi:hypothetical protein
MEDVLNLINFRFRNKLKMANWSHGLWSGQRVWLMVLVMGWGEPKPEAKTKTWCSKSQHVVNLFALSAYVFPAREKPFGRNKKRPQIFAPKAPNVVNFFAPSAYIFPFQK